MSELPKKPADKFILDATAGFRMMWFNKRHPNCIYLDQRPECEPDIVGDFRDLKQFPDETFRLIVFDPPHILKPAKRNLIKMVAAYGALEPDTWKQDLKAAFDELWRVLQNYGVLIFKWSNHQIATSDILSLFHEKPLIYQVSSSRSRRHLDSHKHGSGDRTLQTLWLCFMKIPKEALEQ